MSEEAEIPALFLINESRQIAITKFAHISIKAQLTKAEDRCITDY